MRGRIPTISGGEQDALFRSRLAKGAAVLSTDEPGKAVTPPRGGIQPSVSRCSDMKAASCRRFRVAVSCVFPRTISRWRMAISASISPAVLLEMEKISARIPVALAAPGIVLDHPTGPHSGQRESFREIMDDGRMRQTRSRSCRLSVIDRMVDLIADQLNFTRRGELVQAVQFRIADRCASGIVGTVDQNQLGISIHQLLDLVEIDTEIVLLPNTVVANLDPKGFGQSGKWRIAGSRQDNVGARFRGQPKQNQQSLRGASYDLDRRRRSHPASRR